MGGVYAFEDHLFSKLDRAYPENFKKRDSRRQLNNREKIVFSKGWVLNIIREILPIKFLLKTLKSK
jgi:hypothetical protein